MGCVSSHLLNQDDDFTQISHHIVSLTSTTYGLITLDPSSSPTTVPPTPPPRFTLASIFHSEPATEPPPEVIDSLELMAGLDSTPEPVLEKPHIFQENPNPNRKNPILTNSVAYKPIMAGLDSTPEPILENPHKFQENSNPIRKNFMKSGLDFTQETKTLCFSPQSSKPSTFRFAILEKPHKSQEKANPVHKNRILTNPGSYKPVFLDGFEELCPPRGENRVVIYTTTLRGVRKTFEACNAVRAVLEGLGVSFCERDISMDRGFKEELWELMKEKEKHELVPPRVFVKGRYVGGYDEVLRIVEEGCLGRLLEGLPKVKAGYVCEVCGGARFLPCVTCNGSCKMVKVLNKGIDGKQFGESVSVKCRDCNENGLVCCPVCS